VGGARTALFNYLFARRHGGSFILRIEDTDQTRFKADAMQEIFDSLKWLGLEWDEGPKKDGAYGPYIQSQRLEIYRRQVKQLLDQGHAYYCFCTPERLTALRQEQEKNKMQSGLGYDRHCRSLTATEVQQKLDSHQPHVVRLKIPDQRSVVFHDMIRGDIEYQSDILDDLVLLKSDGYPTYHLANVIDDHLMNISHVLRGDEWIASTPRHIVLYEAFGWIPPKFAHMPVILAPGGGKLSKRSGAASVMDYKNNGYLPDALFNFLALLGWAPGDDREIMSKEEMIQAFSLEKITPKAAVFDEAKLEWMNGNYIRQQPTALLLPKLIARWQEKGWIDKENPAPTEYYQQIAELFKERAKRITDMADAAGYFFNDPLEYEEKAAKKYFKPSSRQVLQTLHHKMSELQNFTCTELEELYRHYAETSELSGGKLIHPTRLAVSGVSFGPGLFELLQVLGKETVLRRLNKAMDWIGIHGQNE
jgi:glutamyl-tRNA synthetase